MHTEDSLSKGKVVLYKNRVEVRLDRDTVWLSLNQLADIFRRDKSVISRHLQNIFKAKELTRDSVVAFFATTAADGKTYQVEHFNLDAIISVGYRVNSKQGTQFRIWATKVLKKYLIDGYILNERRLKRVTHKYHELQKAIALIGNVASTEGASPEARGIAQIIREYSRALDILDDFDHERLPKPAGTRRVSFELTYEAARNVIEMMKKQFKDSALMGQEKDQGLKSSLRTIYQTFEGKDLYPSVQDKAAHLLYFVTKNHSFVDGNKRIAAALFICFLEKNKILRRSDGSKCIDDSALVALTLMIAASKPAEKDAMIKVVLNLIT